MSGKKRPWTTSLFRQYSSFQNNTNERQLTDTAISTVSTVDPISPLTNIATNSNWIQAFAPQTIHDVAVHPKKLREFENWLKHCKEVQRRRCLNPAQLCLLTGPAGAGKTTAARLMAKANGFQLMEWINPLDQELITTLGEQKVEGNYAESQVEVFKAFLLRGSRYKSLLEHNNKRLLMVEDFPNALLNDAGQFERILEEYRNYGKSPLVFIATDSKSRALNISYNLFNDSMKTKFQINHINFNPIASTLLHKAMKRFCTLMRQPEHMATYKIPAQAILDSIVVSAQGDIRNALLNLHFASLKGPRPIELNRIQLLEVSKTKKKSNVQQQSTLKSVGCDESISMMHALGRALNPKFSEQQKRFVHSPETLSENLATEPKQFIDLLFANYLQHFSDIEDITKAINDLSISDLIINEYRENTLPMIALNVAIRSLMVANKAPVSGWMPMRGKQRLESKETEQETRMRHKHCANVSNSMYVYDYRPFVRVIESRKPSDKHSRLIVRILK